MRRLLILLVLPALLLSAYPATAGAHDGRGPPEGRGYEERGHEGRASADRMEAAWGHLNASARDAGLARAEAHGLFARLAYDAGSGNVEGRFVRFHLVASTAQMHDYTIRDGTTNLTFFSEVTPQPFSASAGPRVTGSVLHVLGENVTVLAHNNPTGALQIRADGANATVSFQLASSAKVLNATAREVKIGVGAAHGHILSSGNASIDVNGTLVTVQLAPGEAAMFRGHPSKVDASILHAQNKAFTSGVLGSVVHIADGDGAPVQDESDLGVAVEASEIGRGHLRATVSSDNPAGRVIFLAVDGTTIDPAHAAAIQVTLDGKAVPRAASLDSVVSTNQSAVAFTTDAASGAVYLAIRIPHFSSYVLAIVDPSSGTPAAQSGSVSSKASPGAAILLVAVALLGAAIRRR